MFVKTTPSFDKTTTLFNKTVTMINVLMGLEPVIAKSGIGNEGNSHSEGVLHFFNDDALYLFFFFRIDGEVEFVMDLQNHFTLDAFGFETLEDMDHGHLDDVCSSTLNGGIDGVRRSSTGPNLSMSTSRDGRDGTTLWMSSKPDMTTCPVR